MKKLILGLCSGVALVLACGFTFASAQAVDFDGAR